MAKKFHYFIKIIDHENINYVDAKLRNYSICVTYYPRHGLLKNLCLLNLFLNVLKLI